MANIDLRPWREERRKARQNQFVTILAIVAAMAAGSGWMWNQSVQNKIDFQNTRNTYLENKIAELDTKIREIQTLRQQREELIDRMNVIQSLQGDRPIIVHVFEELVNATPDGVYFTDLSSSGNTIQVSARADKALTISDFLRNIDRSEWFDNAFMTEMVSVKEGSEVVGHNFKLRINRINPVAAGEENES
ncbi:PilN domain-containing protein [Reinekea blandensis]|uniref:Tfp pilus assembly protein PilN n=1 Tax=Reinekea blandensis MED297 TaxID=314283 RepID=A4BAN2_9GAMM|nr:PilN domain-containing protein [Reinekea blandensis]EAR10988.1 Tfp pilus assembly protein PilN [Reinekea sp. MED297] [Reinekea blandensis MED297]